MRKSIIQYGLVTVVFLVFVTILFNNLQKTLDLQKQKEKKEIQKVDAALQNSVGDGDELNPMCLNWTDYDGNVVWKGLSKKAYEQTSQKERKRFLNWYQQYQKEYSLNLSVTPSYAESVSEHFTTLCVSYAGNIPFLEGGREYGLDFVDLTQFYPVPMDTTTMKIGLDSLGYIIWLYRNTFGFTPDGMNQLYKLYSNKNSINTKEQLRVGDICMHQKGKNNYYGVIAGFIETEPVVAWCDNQATQQYKNGSTKLGYITKYTKKYLNGTPPADFQYFFRLDLDWEENK